MDIKVWADKENNLLQIKVTGFSIEMMEGLEGLEEIALTKAKELKNDFVCIFDLSGIELKKLENIELIPTDFVSMYMSMLKSLKEVGMIRLIRVVEPLVYLLTQMIEREAQEGFSTQIVHSIEIAELSAKYEALTP